MNESAGKVLDRRASRHLSLIGTAARTTSTGPFGGGNSARLTVNEGGNYIFGNTGLTLGFPIGGTYPNGELCVSRINLAPDQVPAPDHDNVYWIVNNLCTEWNKPTGFSIMEKAFYGGRDDMARIY
jgi:hypothetical protein